MFVKEKMKITMENIKLRLLLTVRATELGNLKTISGINV